MSTTAFATAAAPALPITRGRLWAGRTLSAVAVLFLLFDTVIKLLKLAPVAKAFILLGMPLGLALTIGVLELACLVLYVMPRTALLGALLLTGFLGGATALHVRVGDPLLSHVLFPSYVATLLWGGLALRDGRLRALITTDQTH
jgi:hypothetical protein